MRKMYEKIINSVHLNKNKIITSIITINSVMFDFITNNNIAKINNETAKINNDIKDKDIILSKINNDIKDKDIILAQINDNIIKNKDIKNRFNICFDIKNDFDYCNDLFKLK